MKALFTTYTFEDNEYPECKFKQFNADSEPGTFVAISLSSKNLYPKVDFFIRSHKELIAFKNSVISAYDTFIRGLE